MAEKLQFVLITDCGTGITSAVLLERTADGFKLTARGEAATTVDPPHSDVTAGVKKAILAIEQKTGRTLLKPDGEGVITPSSGNSGVDLYLSASSTGGGLQMMVAGLVRIMTAESAERAALGAGAMVMDVISIDDGRLAHEKIQRLRELHPDMVLLSGGIDGGNYGYVLELAEHIRAAKLDSNLPIIYAGNVDAQDRVGLILQNKARLFYVDNVRPVLEKEVLEPAGREIHRRFMEHVVARAPGYDKLAKWSEMSILPSTAAIGYIIEAIAKAEQQDILAINIGEATTDVFSSFSDRFTRTVSGDLGVGSSLSNVVLEAGTRNILRWLPFELGEGELRNVLRNRSLHPYNRPEGDEELMIEHAVTREIIRLSIEQHKSSVVGLRGVRRQRDISNVFDQKGSEESMYNPMSLARIVASGTPFRLADNPRQVMAMLVDAIEPLGVTQLTVDRHFTAPHFGMLTTVDKQAALHSFLREGIMHLGTAIRPAGEIKHGESCLGVRLVDQNGQEYSESFSGGELRLWDLPEGAYAAHITPAAGLDVGAGKGKMRTCTVVSGVCGILVDTRNSVSLAKADISAARRAEVSRWYSSLDAYPVVKGEWSN
jgi:uncharacterized protein (TIGR01319 family)